MALIGEIRKNFWFVLIVLGLALAAFVIMDMTGATQGNAMNPTIGTINGTDVDAREFSSTENILSQNSNITDANERRENLWNYFIDKAIVENEVEDLGLNVPVEELKDLQFGQNLSPVIQQSFFNPNTGQVDRAQLTQIQNAIISNQGLTPDFIEFWRVQENQVIANQLQNKLTNLVSKAVYTPSWMAEQEFKLQNTRAQAAYVKVPFDVIENEAIEVRDSDIKAYINKNKALYTNKEENRVIDYISFPVVATSVDSASVYSDMEVRTRELASTENDSIYALNNGGTKPTYYYKQDELPEGVKESIGTLEVGGSIGPYLDNGIYSAIKLVDKMTIPDSVEARLIFRQAPSTNQTAIGAARILLDSLKNLVESGTAQFDSLAITNSQDGSSTSGGDIGYVTQGILPPQLDEVLFLKGNKTGTVYEAKTEAGLFLIELTDIIRTNNDPKYRLAYINAPIIPSQETQDSVLDIVNDFLSDNRNLEDMRTAAQEKGFNVRSSEPLGKNAYRIGTLGTDQSSRNIVRWAFDDAVEAGDVSPDLFSYQDPIDYYTNKYVIVGLNKIISKGVQNVDNLRDQLMPIVRNKKKGEAIKAAISAKDLSSVASQYSLNVDTLNAVTMNSSVIPAIGNEPKVVAAIFATVENSVAGPIIGNSGVYMIQPLEIVQPGNAVGIPSLRVSSTLQNRSLVGFNLMESLKEKAKIEDGRFTYGF